MKIFQGLLKTGLDKGNVGDQSYGVELSSGEEKFHFLLVLFRSSCSLYEVVWCNSFSLSYLWEHLRVKCC